MFVFVLVFALLGKPDPELVGAFHTESLCTKTGKEISHVNGARVSGFTCKKVILFPSPPTNLTGGK